jgi:hypothetical protein
MPMLAKNIKGKAITKSKKPKPKFLVSISESIVDWPREIHKIIPINTMK